MERDEKILLVCLFACAFFELAKLVLDGMENSLQLFAHVLRIGQKVDDNVVTIP